MTIDLLLFCIAVGVFIVGVIRLATWVRRCPNCKEEYSRVTGLCSCHENQCWFEREPGTIYYGLSPPDFETSFRAVTVSRDADYEFVGIIKEHDPDCDCKMCQWWARIPGTVIYQHPPSRKRSEDSSASVSMTVPDRGKVVGICGRRGCGNYIYYADHERDGLLYCSAGCAENESSDFWECNRCGSLSMRWLDEGKTDCACLNCDEGEPDANSKLHNER